MGFISTHLIAYLGIVLCVVTFCHATVTPLTEYVWAPDTHFAWNVSSDSPYRPTGGNYTVYNLYLTSQKWLKESDFNPERGSTDIWRHWLQICIPDNILPDASLATLWIDGGSNKRYNQSPGDIDFILKRNCEQAQLVSAGLYQIPNEPTYFAERPDKRTTEDSMIAYTWEVWTNGTLAGNQKSVDEWLARMPMTKASIKAMDAVQDFITSLIEPNSPYPKPPNFPEMSKVEEFITSGASKRGWTSWMTGCMGDKRVKAIIPVVAPIARLQDSMNEQFRSLGTYSFALQDYVDVGLMPGFLNEPVFKQLLDIIDPLTYGEEMKKTPKYVIVAAGDEFFQPDSAKYFWKQLEGEKHLRIVPNAEHSLAGSVFNVIDSAVQYGKTFVNKKPLPEYEWVISDDGQTIRVNIDKKGAQQVVDVRAWYSRNNTRRDWRLVRCVEVDPECVNPAFFSPTKLQPIADGVYEYTLEAPGTGKYSAFMIEVRFDVGDSDSLFKVTSDLSILPKGVYPYPPCPNDVCKCGWNCPNPAEENQHWYEGS
eukprot:CAMPEP_0201548056 /NCGR_PEP_ID=MMETSP0173_2-20130828/4549_1 /ASSEMBLY_ACC=CAM_ASM_000268 /TAXON_ID=218659 /ORGANISM="Vexillifera sp., Strain DIVA3 564/2" /LENGTH=536 /DNA_ID=CAMNT_0047957297 /DNA_START=43 /DNA_END=1653 /DNA_ORIENTATION=+